MKKQRRMALVLALVLCLCGCAPAAPEDVAPQVQETAQTEKPPAPAQTPPVKDTEDEAPPEVDLSWDSSRRLELLKPAGGKLELPVSGATGYTSVELPLWDAPREREKPPVVEEQPPAPPVVEEPPAPPQGPQQPPQETPTVPPAEAPETTPEDVPQSEITPDEAEVPAEQETGEAAALEDGTSEAAEAASEPPADAEEAPAETEEPQPEAAPVPPPPAPPVVVTEPPEEIDPYEGALSVLAPGTAFTVVREEGEWWYVRHGQQEGWLEHRYCLVNLPDVVPSIVYKATNAYDSQYRSAGKPLSGVTGKALYAGKTYNPRLEREEFMMPVLYSMAQRIFQAQRSALSEGNTLVLYEGYRPHFVQRAVGKALTALVKEDPEVAQAVTTPPWGVGYFIALGYSNHQRGYAMDVSLAKVWQTEEAAVGNCRYLRPVEYDEYIMPTPMHELSAAAVIYEKPGSKTPAPGMNEPAFGLQRYCTGAGLTPLVSEWWHFDDYQTKARVADRLSIGDYEIKDCLSALPPA